MVPPTPNPETTKLKAYMSTFSSLQWYTLIFPPYVKVIPGNSEHGDEFSTTLGYNEDFSSYYFPPTCVENPWEATTLVPQSSNKNRLPKCQCKKNKHSPLNKW